MSMLSSKNWTTGSGRRLSLCNVANEITEHSRKNKKIFIGSDSFISRDKICFVTAVCLLTECKGGRYYFYKENRAAAIHEALASRITEEVRRSIELAEHFMDNCNIKPEMFEVHLDISPKFAGNKTSKFSDMLTGYVQGYGLDYRLKPNAWASQTVADKHSK